MKRLAFVVLALASLAATVPAFAGAVDPPSRPTPSWCARHADAWMGGESGRSLGVYVGIDATYDREVLSAYGCYDLRLPGVGQRSELLNAWWDVEYGTAGASCIRQAPAALVSCKRTAASLPVEGTTPVTHEDQPWWLRLVDVELGYRLDGHDIEVAVRSDERCAGGACMWLPGQRIAVAPDARPRLAGQECRLGGQPSCTRTEAGNGAGVGDGTTPVIAVNDSLAVGGGQLCVEVVPGRNPWC